MLYPLKFKPVFKDYIWGGRNLESLNKQIPDGITAESWEISCRPEGMSIIANGEYAGQPLAYVLAKHSPEITGYSIYDKDTDKFPLLVKFIDANDRLSVQVHPNDEYAERNENGELGKSEMWYILSAKKGAKVIYDVVPGTDKKSLETAIKAGSVEASLKSVDVFAGDVINIPAGVVHALGEGILLAEIQQNSNTTYRVYDYDRADKNGNKRPLHIEKALDVIDFDASGRKEKVKGIKISYSPDYSKTYLIASRYFAIELYDINTAVSEATDGSRFFIFIFTEGAGSIEYGSHTAAVAAGDSFLIPACLGRYTIRGRLNALKAYVPDITKDFIKPLNEHGFTDEQIIENCSVSL